MNAATSSPIYLVICFRVVLLAGICLLWQDFLKASPIPQSPSSFCCMLKPEGTRAVALLTHA